MYFSFTYFWTWAASEWILCSLLWSIIFTYKNIFSLYDFFFCCFFVFLFNKIYLTEPPTSCCHHIFTPFYVCTFILARIMRVFPFIRTNILLTLLLYFLLLFQPLLYCFCCFYDIRYVCAWVHICTYINQVRAFNASFYSIFHCLSAYKPKEEKKRKLTNNECLRKERKAKKRKSEKCLFSNRPLWKMPVEVAVLQSLVTDMMEGTCKKSIGFDAECKGKNIDWTLLRKQNQFLHFSHFNPFFSLSQISIAFPSRKPT